MENILVADNKVVSLIYELRIDGKEGTLVEQLEENRPFEFLVGAGGVLPKFEANLRGLKPGDNFDFSLEAQEAYGASNKDAVVEIPLDAFRIEGKIDEELVKKGNYVPMRDQNGNRLNGMVLDITDSLVVMDFNHPLADESLFYTGKILDIRDASEEELEHGHVHGHHHHHCDGDHHDCNCDDGCSC